MENDKKALSRRVKELTDPQKEEELKDFLDRYLQHYTFKQIRKSSHSIKKLIDFFNVPREMIVLQARRFDKEGYV